MKKTKSILASTILILAISISFVSTSAFAQEAEKKDKEPIDCGSKFGTKCTGSSDNTCVPSGCDNGISAAFTHI